MTPSNFPSERTVVLTGAASARGIGRAAADRMASEGWSIAILDINAEDAEFVPPRRLAPTVRSRPSASAPTYPTKRPLTGQSPRSKPHSRRSLRWPTWRASAPRRRSWKPRWRSGTRSSPSTCAEPSSSSQRVLKGMIERKLGRIVSISSISAQRGGGTYSKVAYSATKAGILGFTRALAREVGEFGITGQCHCPRPDRHRHHGWNPHR